MALFDKFPYLSDEKIIIRMMEEKDLKSLKEITDNTNVYKYCPYFLYKKSDSYLLATIIIVLAYQVLLLPLDLLEGI